MTLSVQRPLQQRRRGSLVDHPASLLGIAAALGESGGGDHRREALIDKPDANWSDRASKRCRKVSCLISSLSSPSGKARGQADDDFYRVPVSRQRGNLRDITLTAPDGRQRASQQPARIAARDPDSRRPDVDGEPDA